jgi:hypothetical protein
MTRGERNFRYAKKLMTDVPPIKDAVKNYVSVVMARGE